MARSKYPWSGRRYRPRKSVLRHADWGEDIKGLFRLGDPDNFWAAVILARTYPKRRWQLRCKWFRGEISESDGKFLLQLSREEALEQLEAVYGKSKTTS